MCVYSANVDQNSIGREIFKHGVVGSRLQFGSYFPCFLCTNGFYTGLAQVFGTLGGDKCKTCFNKTAICLHVCSLNLTSKNEQKTAISQSYLYYSY